MSEENVEIVRRLFAEFLDGLQRGDAAAWFDPLVVSEEYEWVLADPLDGQRVWKGTEGFATFMETWTGQFDDWTVHAERFLDAGERGVIVLTRQTATARRAGCRSSFPWARSGNSSVAACGGT